jgi:hypothetical protein
MTHIYRTQFLYAIFTERCSANPLANKKLDTRLRIVYWNDDAEPTGGHFVIYGNRPDSSVSGKYNPYRLWCATIDNVMNFVNTVISSDANVSVELHQFDAMNDDTEDEFNIDWENNAENDTTELVAFDFLSISDQTQGGRFAEVTRYVLRTLMETDVV